MGRKRKSDVKQLVSVRLYESTIKYIKSTGETMQQYVEKAVEERKKREQRKEEK
jgi:hypothetical protein